MMESALDLSAPKAGLEVKTERAGDDDSASVSSPGGSSSGGAQSPTSTVTSGLTAKQCQAAFMLNASRQFLMPPWTPSMIRPGLFDNPALAAAASLVSHGFGSPGLTPMSPFFAAAAGIPPPPPAACLGSATGEAAEPPTPPASAVFAAGLTNGHHEPSTFLPTTSLAISTLYRRRRPFVSSARSSISTAAANANATANGNGNNVINTSNSSGGGDADNDDDDDCRPPSCKKASKSLTLSSEKKDDLYWERRRKNNEAAKRSRDARRAKEEEIMYRAAMLEQENVKLKAQVAVLKNETAKLHLMLFNHVQSSA